MLKSVDVAGKDVHIDVPLFALVSFQNMSVGILPEGPRNVGRNAGIHTSEPKIAIVEIAADNSFVRRTVGVNDRLHIVFVGQNIHERAQFLFYFRDVNIFFRMKFAVEFNVDHGGQHIIDAADRVAEQFCLLFSRGLRTEKMIRTFDQFERKRSHRNCVIYGGTQSVSVPQLTQ